MDNRMRYWFWSAVSALAFAAFGFFLGIAWQRGIAPICGPFYSAVAAGWVQAIGSLLAIGVAVYIPYKVEANARHRQEGDRRLRSRLVATKLLIPTLTLKHEAVKAAVRLQPIPEGADVSAPVYWHHGQALRLDDVDAIKREWGSLAELSGELPDMFAVLIATVDGYNRRFDTLMSEKQLGMSKLLWERDGPGLALIAQSAATIAQQAFDAAQRESALKLPDAVVAESA